MTRRRKTRHGGESAAKIEFQRPAPEGASDFERRAASLKRCPDTNPEFLRSLIFTLLVLVISAAILCTLSTTARAADAASGDVVLRALREEMERSKANLKLENGPAPYYIEYRVTEIDQFDASGVFGALRHQQHEHGRLFRVVVRVGDYKQDSFFGTGEGNIDLVPSDVDLLSSRRLIWLPAHLAYRSALRALTCKQAALKQ